MLPATRSLGGVMLLLALGLLAGGCSRQEQLVEAKGRVTFEGQPVSDGVVVFENGAAGISLSTKLQADGSFVVASYQGAGLPPGTYQVAVRPPVPDQKSLNELMQPRKSSYPNIPEKYRNPQTSGLTAEVKAEPNDFAFDMLSPHK